MDHDLSGPGWRCLWPAACELGEGPVWHDGALWFVDIEAPAVHRFEPDSGERFSWTPPCRIGAIAPRGKGGFVAGTERGFAFVDPLAGTFEPIGHPEAHLPESRFNDGKADAAGVFWAGTMDDRKQRRCGALYRLDASLAWTRADDGYRITNGPAFSPDGGTLYQTDTLARETYAFTVTADGLADKRLFAAWPDGWGYPDGMTTDVEGCLWVAFWGGACVRRIAPDGTLLAEHAVPAAHVTSCAFGGAGLDRLFVTTARQGLEAAGLGAQPLAGGLFEVFPGVVGLPAGVFAG